MKPRIAGCRFGVAIESQLLVGWLAGQFSWTSVLPPSRLLPVHGEKCVQIVAIAHICNCKETWGTRSLRVRTS